jgi:hypothetical protein
MMFDHDLVEGEFKSAILNDLTMWPKTMDPSIFKASNSAHKERIQA